MRHFASLIFILILTVPSVCASEYIYFLNLHYDRGALGLLDVYVITGYPIASNDSSLPYRLELLSTGNEVLYQGYFDIPNKLYAVPPLNPGEKSGVVVLDRFNFSVSLPYYKNGNIIRMFKGDTALLDVDVSKFSMYCGDSICEPDETNCPQDCEIPSENKAGDKKSYAGIISLFAFIIILGIALLAFLRKRRA